VVGEATLLLAGAVDLLGLREAVLAAAVEARAAPSDPDRL